MEKQQPTVAFFGATGGCLNACLALALQAGYHCTALARTPSKLHDLLHQHNVSDSAIEDYLTITQGNVTDIQAVQQTLHHNGRPVDLIISGIGGKPRFDCVFKPTLDNPTVCQDATRTILAAAQSSSRKPRLVAISTTGLSNKRDIPVMMMPLYHWLLKVPHEDKKVMEGQIVAEMEKPVAERAIDNYLLVRPSLLVDGNGDGLAKIKTGTDTNPAIGYVICRRDVGLWIFENAIRRASDSPSWGQIVTLTV
ncbi:hypothetical protein BO94DRAFT_529545 [Aspergillus sclerotioniger CBS 115572]|uniref:NAD(P)-binding domain-containing protein n=1 Tax=Aspergillus sclerotioniger CBS 115572 TaxID=1450535 RepID=A0A317XC67_9EURO|nr:hypothetical protein BO94DRAFT_529545 [Aspergillus sclerotioniger CBS 115572]PWY96133.1 hypothetical protein BO94DRAFT_529545 [Aspergillus sclerotioniger CBS 115572]